MLLALDRLRAQLMVMLAAPLIIFAGCGGRAAEKIRPADISSSSQDYMNLHRAYDHFGKALLYEYIGHYEKAADEYRLALRYDPTSEELIRSLTGITYQLRRYDETLELMLRIKNRTYEDLITIADCYNNTGNLEMAAKYSGLAAELDTMAEFPNSFLAQYYSGKGEYSKAEFYIQRLIRNSSHGTAWRLELAAMYLRAGEHRKASAVYQEMIEDNPADHRGYLGKASVLEMQYDTSGADSLYRYVAEKNWDDAQALTVVLQSLVRLNDLEEAVKVSRRITELFPGNYFGMRQYALLTYQNGNYQTADSILTALAQAEVDDPLVYYYLGRLRQRESNYIEAESLFTRAVVIDDTLTGAWVNLAAARDAAGNFAGAREALTQAMTHSPKDSLQIYHYTGMLLVNNEKYEEAIGYYQKVLAVEDTNTDAMFGLASAYERDRQYERAEMLFSQLLETEPDNAAVLNYLGYMYADLGIKLDKAEQLIKKALEKAPDNGAYLDSYAWVLYKKGKYDEALMYQQKALERGGDDAIYYDHIGDIYQALNRHSDALVSWNKALELDPDNEAIQEKLKR